MNGGGNLIGSNPCAGLPLWLSDGAFHLMTAAADQEAYPVVAFSDYHSATLAASLPFLTMVSPLPPFSQADYVAYYVPNGGPTDPPDLQLYVGLNVLPFWQRVLAVCGVTQIPASSGPVMTAAYAGALPASTSSGPGVFQASYVLVSPSLDSRQWDRWWSVG